MTNFLILTLATWRLSSLLAEEEGPFGVLGKFRKFAGVIFNGTTFEGTNTFSEGLICMWCNSVWIGLGLALLLCLPSVPETSIPTLNLTSADVGIPILGSLDDTNSPDSEVTL